MKRIAIPITSDNKIEDHFGHSRFYEIYTVSNANNIVDLKLIESEPGCGCKSNIVDILAQENVSFLLTGNIGKGALNKLNKAGIQAIRGCSGESANVILQYIGGKIFDNGETCSNHKHHHETHDDHVCNH